MAQNPNLAGMFGGGAANAADDDSTPRIVEEQ
jgi:hypothetical protein